MSETAKSFKIVDFERQSILKKHLNILQRKNTWVEVSGAGRAKESEQRQRQRQNQGVVLYTKT